jgi:copper(I)-binding protein
MQQLARFGCALAVILCSLFAGAAEMPATGLVLQSAWVRAPAPGADVASLYFVLRKTGTRPAVVVAVRSPMAHQAMLHQTLIEQGQAKMRPQDRLLVAPGGTVTLAPGGTHVMLHGLTGPLTIGAAVPIVLVLEDGQVVSGVATVRPIASQ